MGLRFDIVADRGLVIITYTGFASIDETTAVFTQFAQHPDAAAGQKHLLDLSAVTEFEQDFPRFMALQATQASLGSPIMPSMIVFYAPTVVSQRMAEMSYKSWSGQNGPVVAMIDDEADALALVGYAEQSIADLTRSVRED